MDWKDAKTEYENGGVSCRKIAERLGVSESTIRRRAEKEGWRKAESVGKSKNAARNVKADKAQTDGKNKNGGSREEKCAVWEIGENMFAETPKNEIISRVADKLLYSVARAADELDRYIMKNKVKTKTVEYDDSSGKAEREIIREDECICEASGIVDRVELRQLVTALKDIKEIYEVGAQGGGKIEELIRGLCDDDKNIQ